MIPTPVLIADSIKRRPRIPKNHPFREIDPDTTGGELHLAMMTIEDYLLFHGRG
jgi:hypothetical protein